MGDCHCSNIAIMQLFHELKQQFPALPDHVVSQCITENSHDKDICAASLREAEKSTRPFFGSFPLASGTAVAGNPSNLSDLVPPKTQRPLSLDIGPLSSIAQQRQYSSNKRRFLPPLPPLLPPIDSSSTFSPSHRTQAQAPSSAPPISSPRDFFSYIPGARSVTGSSPIRTDKRSLGDIQSNLNALTPTKGFNLNVNVACSPVGAPDSRDFITTDKSFKHPSTGEKSSNNISEAHCPDLHTRSYTSVSLTLRPPSSEPQPPINIRSQGSSLTYSTSSSDPRGFQSRLRISIGPTPIISSVSAARMRPTMNHIRSNVQRSPDVPSSSSLHEGITPLHQQHPPAMSVPSVPVNPTFSLSCNTPTKEQASPRKPSVDLSLLGLNQVAERQLVTEQYIRKEKLAEELNLEKGKLATMRKELEALSRPRDPLVSLQELGKRLRSEIYQLRLECNLLADEVDQRSDPTVPFGETNEEFYQGIYTGQAINLPAFTSHPSLSMLSSPPPPIPRIPPALVPSGNGNQVDDNRDGPSWICEMCTFDNHPLMDTCEQCDMPRFPSLEAQGETQDIHIRVTHHHNFSPRRAVHSWVV